jgi:predicted dienelactone hydrolase
MSHASGGQFGSLTWLATGLAQHGAIVLAVNHPGTTFGDLGIKGSLDLKTRVRDLQAALETAAADPRFASHLDTTRIYATGYLLGGWTALSIGGLRGNPLAYARHCRLVGERSGHCLQIARAGVDFETLDPTPWQISLRDPRIRGVAAIEPELLYGLSPDDTKGLVSNVTLIGLGSSSDRLRATDFSDSGSSFGRLVPTATLKTIAPASHFTAMPECMPAGAEILASDGDDPVCTDPLGTDRRQVHAEIVAAVASAFDLH